MGCILFGSCLAVEHERLLSVYAILVWGCAGLSHLNFSVQAAEASKHFPVEPLIFQTDQNLPPPPKNLPFLASRKPRDTEAVPPLAGHLRRVITFA